ncbi:MAG: diphosphomevalonate decarboxylase [Lentisphaerae bacterium]|nr:diphosphomevalonate decarboxylase [Lentisphaerota bacterium]
MIPSPADVFRALIPPNRREPVQASAAAFAPANIALVKYWGKRDERLNLPVTSSLSVSLGKLGSDVRLCGRQGRDVVTLNGKPLPDDSSFVRRVSSYLDFCRPAAGWGFEVTARNTIPTAAGFASSASGFAALVRALDGLFGWHLDGRALSILARLGSGSASRSIFEGLVEWHAGCAADGMDSYAEPLGVEWADLRMALIVLSRAEKGIGSRAAMQRTVETSPLYAAWPATVHRDMAEMKSALQERDFTRTGAVAERNALAMHATMLAASPPVLYWQPESVRVMQKVWALRAEGVPVYFTMDAGPNVKVLYLADTEPAVREGLADWEFVKPNA